MNANWKPNEKQVAFMGALSNGGMTLREASKKVGFEVKSGTVNALVSKGLVATEDYTYDCEIVAKATGEVVGNCKKTVKVYALVQKD